MPDTQLADFARRMKQLVDWSEQLNLAVGRACPPPSEEIRRMSRLSLWLTLAFAFDGFVQAAWKVLGSKPRFRAAKAASPGEPDIVVRLKLLSEETGLNLGLPGESGEDVIRRHFGLRNKWAHNLGVLQREDETLVSIICWDGPGNPAWPSEAGWSELRRAVGNLADAALRLNP